MGVTIHQLLEGDLLSCRVLRRLGAYRFEVALLGEALPVNSNARLQEGQQVLVHLLRKAPRLHLKLLGTLNRENRPLLVRQIRRILGKTPMQFQAALWQLLKTSDVPLNAKHLRTLGRRGMFAGRVDPLHGLFVYALQRCQALPISAFPEDFLIQALFGRQTFVAWPPFDRRPDSLTHSAADLWFEDLVLFVTGLPALTALIHTGKQSKSLLPEPPLFDLYFQHQQQRLRTGLWALLPAASRQGRHLWGLRLENRSRQPRQGEFFWLAATNGVVNLRAEGQFLSHRLTVRLFRPQAVATCYEASAELKRLEDVFKAAGFEDIYLSFGSHRQVWSVLSQMANVKHLECSC